MKHDFDTTEHYQNAGIVGGLQKKQKKNMRTKNEHKNAKALNAKILAECFCSAVQRFSKMTNTMSTIHLIKVGLNRTMLR